MWQNDTVTLQTVVVNNVYGDLQQTWVDSEDVVCDVQDINKELVFQNYGINDNTDYKEVYDLTLNTGWVKGNQVKFDNEQWWVRIVNKNMGKMADSNHVFILLSKVI